MPGGDGTGPAGAGPMTGRAAGYCAGQGAPGYMNPIGGRGGGGGGFGFGGRGGGQGGRGRRNRFYATGLTGWQRAAQVVATPPAPPIAPVTQTPQSGAGQLDMLQAQVQQAEAVLAGLKQRVEELAKSGVEKSPQ